MLLSNEKADRAEKEANRAAEAELPTLPVPAFLPARPDGHIPDSVIAVKAVAGVAPQKKSRGAANGKQDAIPADARHQCAIARHGDRLAILIGWIVIRAVWGVTGVTVSSTGFSPT